MNRMFFIAVALFALMAGFLPSQTFAMDHAQHAACMKECNTCAAKCEDTIAYCKKKGGSHVEAKHIAALEDCVIACKNSETFMKRGSSLMNKACALCEEACRKCAETCDTFKDDKVMKDCADECRKCADSCKKMQES